MALVAVELTKDVTAIEVKKAVTVAEAMAATGVAVMAMAAVVGWWRRNRRGQR